ncbi:sulfurtransferase [Geitlerinema sp. PCC 9228]|jgi:thiosulfate/3-mercaptopyruvate sulfurtransferase|uniref:sulfurtransferase n=1 Tax=Geitlerinema sp. PCC 9228 TaxID=111611 RepID=UPI0008F9B7B8|nr:sulfurtransferase [Geitlerinema sp. PCC 9228]
MYPHLVVSTEWLYQQLYQKPDADPTGKPVVIDCRFSLAEPEWGYQQYLQAHIPGAFYLDLNRDLSSKPQKHGGRHPLPNTDQLAPKLAALGITSQETMVVAYDDSKFAFASRLWWLLRYMGHPQVAVLNGGWSGWQRAGYPTSAEIPQKPKTGDFVPQLQLEMVVDRAYVQQAQVSQDQILVDSRSRDRYLGQTEPIDPVAGTIPTSVNYFWKDVTNDDGELLPIEQQQKRWQNIGAADEAIVYCGSGVTACVNLLSMEAAGVRNRKLYVGGWSDWCSYF